MASYVTCARDSAPNLEEAYELCRVLSNVKWLISRRAYHTKIQFSTTQDHDMEPHL